MGIHQVELGEEKLAKCFQRLWEGWLKLQEEWCCCRVQILGIKCPVLEVSSCQAVITGVGVLEAAQKQGQGANVWSHF